MEYLCFTTKHHDGFCMWDTEQTDYKVTNTPYKRDVLAMLAEACRRRGILLGLYYSLPDWHHPNYPNQGRHHEMFGPRPGDEPDEAKYLEYVRAQVRELLTGYGPIHEMFWDVNVAEFSRPVLQRHGAGAAARLPHQRPGTEPGRLLDAGAARARGAGLRAPHRGLPVHGPRELGLPRGRGLLQHEVPDGEHRPDHGDGRQLPAERRAEARRHACPDQCVADLARIGRWYNRVKEAFVGAVPCSSMVTAAATHLFRYDDVLLTRKGNIFYAHCPQDLQTSAIVLPGIEAWPRSAVLLNDGRPLRSVVDTIPWRWKEKPCLRVTGLPVNEITDEPLVVRLDFDDAVAE